MNRLTAKKKKKRKPTPENILEIYNWFNQHLSVHMILGALPLLSE